MRTTKLLIQKNGAVSLMEASTPIGYSGEHNAVVFLLGLSEEIMQYFGNPSYFRFVINGWYSEPVYPINNEISYCLPQSCLTPPKINCQIIGYVISEGVPKEISKSAVFNLEVGFSEGMQGQLGQAPNAIESALARCEKFEKDSANNAKSAEEYFKSAAKAAENAENSVLASQQNATKSEQVLAEMETAADSGRFDGFSPVANVKEIPGGVSISITDKNGTTEEPIYHGISPDLRRCLRFIGALETESNLPDFAAVGDVYSIGSARVLYNAAVSQRETFADLPTNIKSFDLYAKTDDYRSGGDSLLYFICNEPVDITTGVSNFEGENTLYLHFEIADSVLTVTGERVYSEGKEWESRFSINKQMALPEEIYYMGFYLATNETEEERGTVFSGPGLSVARITESTSGTPTLYVFDGASWLPMSSSSGGDVGDIEAALDKIIEIQNSLIGGESL